MLGLTRTIPVKKLAKRFELQPEEIELSLEALQYLILHISKTNAVSIEDFSSVYEQTGLKKELGIGLYTVIKGHVAEIRAILDKENKIGVLSLQ